MAHSDNQHSGGVALIALGSNLGDSKQNILQAVELLQRLSSFPIRQSSLWKSTPVDCPPGSPDFINAAAALIPHPVESPETLLVKLKAIERDFGRKTKSVLNEPRPLDLDLIAFGNEVRTSEPSLILPHPRAHLRKFVLQPLSEIVPQFVLPGHNKTIHELLAELKSDEVLMRIS